jgi:hypothetical protein
MQKYYHLKKEGSQLHTGPAMSCLKRVEKDLAVMETQLTEVLRTSTMAQGNSTR